VKIETPGGEKESVNLPPIVVRPGAQEFSTEEPAVISQTEAGEGKVLAINRENNFVVIDLGEAAGIKVGNTFHVYREDQPIATIQAIQTRRDIAACDIKQETETIKIGDTIR